MRAKFPLIVSVCIALLIIITSCTAFFTPGFYNAETINWRVQSIGQDGVNLFIILPFLMATATAAHNGNETGLQMWGGTVFYLAYTFAIYCFDIRFNSLFVPYCLLLGLSMYSSLYFLLSQKRKQRSGKRAVTSAEKAAGIYFLIIAVLFYCLWLSEIIPATAQGLPPESLVETGLPSNPVHVLDLAVCLPGIFITGIGVLRQYRFALRLIPAVLVFFILMDAAIALMAAFMKYRSVTNDVAVIPIMSVLAVLSAGLLLWHTFTNRRTVAV